MRATDQPTTVLPRNRPPRSFAHPSPIVETSIVETSIVETSIVETPIVETSIVETSPVDASSVDASSVDAPSVDAPAVDASSVDASSVDAPLLEPRVDVPPFGPPSSVKTSRGEASFPKECEARIESLRRRHPARMGIALRDARDIHALATEGGFLDLGFASVGQLSESLSLSAAEGLRLFAVGRALAFWPALEGLLLAGRLNLDKAAALAHLLDVPGTVLPGEDWLRMAQQETTVRFQRRVNRRVEETLRGEPVERMAFWVTQDCKDGFRRARTLASRAAQRRLSRGETLHLLVDRYLDAVDPLRVRPRERRLGGTAGTPDRHVPEAVKRFVRRRAGDACEFPRCSYDLWLDFAHIVPHRAGGSREVDNLLLLCSRHHRWVDTRLVGMERRAGRIAFTLPNGAVLPGPELLPSALGLPPFPVPSAREGLEAPLDPPDAGVPPDG